jgi:hypothetical protein
VEQRPRGALPSAAGLEGVEAFYLHSPDTFVLAPGAMVRSGKEVALPTRDRWPPGGASSARY